MDCREKIVSEDYLNLLVDYIADFDLLKQNGVDYCFVPIEENFGILYVSRTNLLPLSASEYRYAFIPKCYGLAAREETSGLFSTIKQSENAVYGEYRLQQEGQRLAGAYEDSGILRVQQPPLSLTGNGVLIGFVDTGIRYTLPAFQKEDGSTKLHSVWDQTQQTGESPQGLPYGTVFSKEVINENLRLRKTDQTIPLLFTDENGHGTKVASVAENAAPHAELVVVKCRQAKRYLREYYQISQTADAYEESDIVAALKYLHDVSERENKPIVICMTMGTNMGDHAGTSFLDRYLTLLTNKRHHCVVIGGGNEGNTAHHYEGSIMLQAADAYEDVEVHVSDGVSGFIMELWGKIPNVYTISLRSPDGEMISRIPDKYGQTLQYSFVYSKSRVSVDYIPIELNSGEELIFLRFETPLAGIWTIRVYAEGSTGIAGFHSWLPISAFLNEPVYFLRPDPYTTMTEPAYCENAIDLTYYDSSNNSFAIDSGRGFQRQGLITPDLSVAGIRVQTALGLSSGSSIAAGLMAGATAQFMQWAVVERKDPVINSKGIRNYFIRGAEREKTLEYPNRQWGDNGIIVSDQASQGNHNPEPAAFSGKIIKGIMFFAESHNGACSNPVICSVGIGQSVLFKGDLSLIRVFNLKHESRLMDTTDDNFSFIFRELFTGFYGIFQSVGKADGKFCRIDGEYFRNGKMELHGDPRFFCLTQISSERGI